MRREQPHPAADAVRPEAAPASADLREDTGLDPICTACGTQFPMAAAPPLACPICEDERQFVPASGQGWTTPEALARGHRNAFREEEDGLLAFETVPKFAIGQRAFLVLRPEGNVLWDCVALLDAATRRIVTSLGGITTIAISHPHYYTTMGAWADAFGARILLHEADSAWVMRPHPAIRFWNGDAHDLGGGATLVRLGGHFEGATVLHLARDGGTLLAGDVVTVVADRRWATFMRSYPNQIPLAAPVVATLAARLAPYRFARLHGHFDGLVIAPDADSCVQRSARRYRLALGDAS